MVYVNNMSLSLDLNRDQDWVSLMGEGSEFQREIVAGKKELR